MFNAGDIVKVLIPNVVNAGYDYRLTAPADIGALVRVTVMMRPYVGVIIGPGDSNLPPQKIKSVSAVLDGRMSANDLRWIHKMADWTMMAPGAVLRLILNVPDAFAPPRVEQLYTWAIADGTRMTTQRQMVADAFAALTEQEQSILILHCVLGMSDGKIGEIMELSRYAVQRRRRKALDELRNKLAALMPKGG